MYSGIQGAIHRLSVLLGQDPGALTAELSSDAPVPVTPPEVPVGLRSDLLQRRPDLRQAEAEIASATAHVAEAKAEWFPRFTVFGTAGRQASQLHDITLGVGNYFSAGPAISVPIFTGGRIRSNIRVQDARLQQSVLRYRSAVLSALEETENALVNYSNEQSRHERLESAVLANEEAVKLRTLSGWTDRLPSGAGRATRAVCQRRSVCAEPHGTNVGPHRSIQSVGRRLAIIFPAVNACLKQRLFN